MCWAFVVLFTHSVAGSHLNVNSAEPLTLNYGIPEAYLLGVSQERKTELIQVFRIVEDPDLDQLYCIGSIYALTGESYSDAISWFGQHMNGMQNSGFNEEQLLNSENPELASFGRKIRKIKNDYLVARVVAKVKYLHGAGGTKLLKAELRQFFLGLGRTHQLDQVLKASKGLSIFGNKLKFMKEFDRLSNQIEQYAVKASHTEDLTELYANIQQTLKNLKGFLS